MPPRAYIIRTDGACRGNPGPASIGVALYDASTSGSDDPDATPIASISAAIGTTTNNVAEWSKFGVAHTPTALKLLNDKLAIQEQINLARAEFRSKVNRRHHSAPLCNVIRSGADRCGD